jgi:hypothetical protein
LHWFFGSRASLACLLEPPSRHQTSTSLRNECLSMAIKCLADPGEYKRIPIATNEIKQLNIFDST